MKVIITCSDWNYYDLYGRYLINSINKNISSDTKLYFYRINYNQWDTTPPSYNFISYRNIVKPENVNMRDFASQIRTEVIVNDVVSDNNIESMLYIDTDSLVRRNLEFFWEYLKDCDFTCRYRGKFNRNNTYTSGVYGCKMTDISKHFLTQWNNRCSTSYKFYNDQISLYDTMEEFKDTLSYKPLDRMFWESGRGNKNTCIMSPWGSGKQSEWFKNIQLEYR